MAVAVEKLDGGKSFRLRGEAGAVVVQANSFLEALELRGLSVNTVRAYAFDLSRLLRWMRESRREVAELNQGCLLEFVAEQRGTAAKPSSINRRLVVAALFFRFVTGSELPRGLYASAPGPHYTGRGRDHSLGLHSMHRYARLRLRVKAEHKLVEPLAAHAVTSFFGTLKRYRDLALVYLMLLCGLRSAEVLALKLSDVDATERRLRIWGKGNKERVLPLPAVLSAVLADYLRLERPTGAATDRLFLVLKGRHRGQPMTMAGLRNLFRQRRASSSVLRPANAHRFRHTFGADMARAGVRLAVLQRMMGHADAKTTLQYINLSMADVAAEFARASQAIEKQYELAP